MTEDELREAVEAHLNTYIEESTFGEFAMSVEDFGLYLQYADDKGLITFEDGTPLDPAGD